MVRTALKARWLALLAVVLLAATVMAWLGDWQLDRARQNGTAAARSRASAPPASLLDVLQARQAFPGSAVGRGVVATGTWDLSRQVIVTPRLRNGLTGCWVVAPLRLADGSAVPVVRGWSPVSAAGSSCPAAVPAGEPAGTVRLVGVLEPSEPPADRPLADRSPADRPQGTSPFAGNELTNLAVVDLLDRWPWPLLTGFVIRTGQDPHAATHSPSGLAPVTPPSGGGLALQNLSYAVQWWLFAAFGLLFWWRLVRDDHRGVLPGPDPASVPSRNDPVASSTVLASPVVPAVPAASAVPAPSAVLVPSAVPAASAVPAPSAVPKEPSRA